MMGIPEVPEMSGRPVRAVSGRGGCSQRVRHVLAKRSKHDAHGRTDAVRTGASAIGIDRTGVHDSARASRVGADRFLVAGNR